AGSFDKVIHPFPLGRIDTPSTQYEPIGAFRQAQLCGHGGDFLSPRLTRPALTPAAEISSDSLAGVDRT
ncbi:MAG TPA: hypothetical protein VK438_14635, partial [Xanthobacteraceae bacterium]|nr:hypothetical protein [Xanthobacteraceae bacterium]